MHIQPTNHTYQTIPKTLFNHDKQNKIRQAPVPKETQLPEYLSDEIDDDFLLQF